MGMILRIASSRIVGQGDIVGRSGYFSLNLSANSVMRGCLDARRTLKSLVADLREINHSTDFNEAFPKSAKDGEANYSGGKEGSGQPAIVYAANVDLSSGEKSFEANLMGHSSPDGSSGEVNKDTSGLTTALHIVKRITVIIQ